MPKVLLQHHPGAQGTVERVDHFQGLWKAGAQVMALQQAGAVVSGCYGGTPDGQQQRREWSLAQSAR
jgi:hypothetical protein